MKHFHRALALLPCAALLLALSACSTQGDAVPSSPAASPSGSTGDPNDICMLTAGVPSDFTMFTVNGTHNGTFNIKTVSPGQGIEWDSSELLTKGLLRVAATQSIKGLVGDGSNVDVYSVDGIKLRGNVNRDSALDGLAPGVYVVDGEKLIKE